MKIAGLLFAIAAVAVAQHPNTTIVPPSPPSPISTPNAPQAPQAPKPVVPKAPYSSDHGQLLVYKNRLLDAQANLLQSQLQQMKSSFDSNKQLLQEWEDKVKQDNGWDNSTIYNPEQDTWYSTAPPTPAAPEVKPAEPVKKK